MVGPLSHHYLHEIAKNYPNKIAITDGSHAITYNNFDTRTNQLANMLMKLGVSRGDRVVYFLPRSIDCIVATIGILKSSAAYVPVDSNCPLTRWQQIVVDASPRAVICNSSTLRVVLDRLRDFEAQPMIISLDRNEDVFEAKIFYLDDYFDTHHPGTSIGELDDIAYVLYTSGSTGMPKGVMITHGNIRNYIDWALEYFNISVDDRILSTAPFVFDMSTFDIFSFLASGATLCLATNDILLFPERLVRFIEQEAVTIWKAVSSLLMYMSRAKVIRSGRMPTMRTVIFAGEPLDSRYLADWMKAFPKISFFNGYGPTEATGVSLCYHVEDIPGPGQSIPIGQPCKGASVILIGDDDQPVGHDEVGELCIAGPCLAEGYLNDEGKTMKYFTPPPSGYGYIGSRIYHTGDLVRQRDDGNYVFVSRKDNQVKWMGYRIELGEIELNLLAYPKIKCAVVLLVNASSEGLSELVAFFEADEEVNPSEIAQFLAGRLPAYMIPKRFIKLAFIPRNDRGKIDREKVIEQWVDSKEDNHTRVI